METTPVKAPARELESTAIVRFQDCDPFGHLNNARYIDYFMNARTDQVEAAYGIVLMKPGDEQSWVVTRNYLAYLLPAGMGETVRIRTRMIRSSETSVMIEGVLEDIEGKRPKAVAWIDFTYVSVTTGRPARHGEDYMDLFGQITLPNIEAMGFEERVEAVRTEYREARKNGR